MLKTILVLNNVGLTHCQSVGKYKSFDALFTTLHNRICVSAAASFVRKSLRRCFHKGRLRFLSLEHSHALRFLGNSQTMHKRTASHINRTQPGD